MAYSLIQGDLEPDMQIPLTVNGAPMDLTGALSVDMEWMLPDGSVVTVGLSVVAPATAGLVKKTWAAGETSMAGTHRGRVVVTWPGSPERPQTFPNNGSWEIWNVYAAP